MITRRLFGKLPNGHDVYAFDLVSDKGLHATILEYGATLQSLRLPSGLDIVLGFDDLQGYLGPHPYFGAAIGRVANRIQGAQFKINGELYEIPANEGRHNLHGGPDGFERALWQGGIDNDKLILTHISRDGHQGFPGRLMAQMVFSIQGHTLSLDMHAQTDKLTPINLTHHSYFNLTDGGMTSALVDHELSVFCEHYLGMKSDNIPSGDIRVTADSAMDYRQAKMIAPNLNDCFVKHQDMENKAVNKLAKLTSKTTGNMLIICSSQPSVQIYSGQYIPKIIGKSNAAYGPHHGIAIEPQNFPNAVNEKNFPSPLLAPKKLYQQMFRYTLKDSSLPQPF